MATGFAACWLTCRRLISARTAEASHSIGLGSPAGGRSMLLALLLSRGLEWFKIGARSPRAGGARSPPSRACGLLLLVDEGCRLSAIRPTGAD